jgi:acyl-CoA reductase-like NAD-dependent aldehyde dehydrogenase
MGGKNAIVVLKDADLSTTVSVCLQASFGSTGQRCTAATRIIVEQGLLRDFSSAFVAAARAIVVGHALSPDTQMGPVASKPQLESNLAYIRQASEDRAVVVGGEVLTASTDGYFQHLPYS